MPSPDRREGTQTCDRISFSAHGMVPPELDVRQYDSLSQPRNSGIYHWPGKVSLVQSDERDSIIYDTAQIEGSCIITDSLQTSKAC